MYRQRLLEFGIAEADVVALEEDVLRRVDEATEAAKVSPPPSPDVIAKDVWADGGSAWRN